jgi:DNA (cytosine-5)-methyltransferase 1
VRFVDWFAGVGLFRLGLERAGHECVGSCEINEPARAVYGARFGRAPEGRDILDVDAKDIAEADLWVGGFPCQDLSCAGKRAGWSGERSVLVFDLLRLATARHPRWILLENVRDLLTVRGGRDFGVLLCALEDAGYDVAWRLLDARWFGVPQRRRRVFILAGRSGEGPHPVEILQDASCGRRHLEARARKGETVANALTSRPGGRQSTEDNYLVGNTLRASEGARGPSRDMGQLIAVQGTAPTLRASVMKCQTNGCKGSELFVLSFDRQQITSRENRSRVDEGAPAPTLCRRKNGDIQVAYTLFADGCSARKGGAKETDLARCIDRNGSWTSGQGGTVVAESDDDGWLVRSLTPRECERLQGAPDDWTLIPGTSDSRRYEQIGNAVAVPVIKWLGDLLRKVERR